MSWNRFLHICIIHRYLFDLSNKRQGKKIETDNEEDKERYFVMFQIKKNDENENFSTIDTLNLNLIRWPFKKKTKYINKKKKKKKYFNGSAEAYNLTVNTIWTINQVFHFHSVFFYFCSSIILQIICIAGEECLFFFLCLFTRRSIQKKKKYIQNKSQIKFYHKLIRLPQWTTNNFTASRNAIDAQRWLCCTHDWQEEYSTTKTKKNDRQKTWKKKKKEKLYSTNFYFCILFSPF